MKYRKTTLNQLTIFLLIGSLVFFVALYLFSGSGPWDIFLYLWVLALIMFLLIVDFFIQLFKINSSNKP
jgi:phosphatidylglycerophosphate synthase